MKHFFCITLLLSFTLLYCDEEDFSALGTTIPNLLNVRIRPDTGSAVVAELPQNSEVNITGKINHWYRIRLPRDGEMWVMSSFVREDGTALENTPLRSGPGVAYEPYGTAGKNVLKIIQRVKNGKWLKIEPDGNFEAYVHADYVNLIRIDTPLKKMEKIIEPEERSESPFIEGYEQNIAMEGIVLSLRDTAPLATHALVTRINADYYPMAYLHSANSNLKLWENRKVRIRGIRRWVENWNSPYVEVIDITPSWQTPDPIF